MNAVNPTNGGDTGDNIIEASATAHEINKKGRAIESDLVNLNGQVQIDDDDAPALESIPSPVEGEDSGSNNIYYSGREHDGVCN